MRQAWRPMLPKTPPMPKVKPPREETRWIETEMGFDAIAWVCEQCEFTTQFECDGPEEHEYNFCPRCGRKITEFVKYRDPLEEVEE